MVTAQAALLGKPTIPQHVRVSGKCLEEHLVFAVERAADQALGQGDDVRRPGFAGFQVDLLGMRDRLAEPAVGVVDLPGCPLSVIAASGKPPSIRRATASRAASTCWK